ncbi:sarcosine oxidase subunit gamma [Amycolatopsis marina]|uniref:Sarcosine oxidase subunit gamma n=1 Tax=Amycolatopsis marina TaxID=490629 RepID=A0A1I1AZC7_9PSEU|nr:sarcosine oxidase subunit gamma family protein [Amycolatopsis marina]SFB43197.1 sarcosine oxidase subunit gamma [Amycolatopsis marina]
MVDHFASPLAHLAGRLEAAGNDQVAVEEIPFLTQLNVRATPDGAAFTAIRAALGVALPRTPNTVTRTEDLLAMWLGPDEWLVLGPATQQDHLEKLVRHAVGEEFGTVTDVSAQRTVLRVSGPMATDLLAGGCALDLDAGVFTDGHCAQTLLAKAPVLLAREERAVLVAVRSSFADYLARWLLDAMNGSHSGSSVHST